MINIIKLNMLFHDMQTVLYELQRQPLSKTLREMHVNSFVSTQIIIDIRDIMTNLMIL